MFGLTLTHHRSQLQVQAMTNLAELCMHLQDEHLHNGTRRACLSHNITSHTAHPNLPHSNTMPTECLTTNLNPNEVKDHPNTEPAISSFHGVVTWLVQGVVDDDADGGVTFCKRKVNICALFDFENTYWQSVTEAHALQSMGEEMELNEMVDVEADGTLDPADSLGGMAESTL